MKKSAARLTLYYRQDCHLCDDMREQLQAMQNQRPFELLMADVDGDPALEKRYGSLVPVLASGHGVICNYYLDPVAVTAFLDSAV